MNIIDFRKYLTKKNIYSFLLSFIIVGVCFAIIIFRVFYPYHRVLAIILYLISWVFYIYPLLNKSTLRKIEEDPKLGYIRKQGIIILGFIVFCVILFFLFVIFPVYEMKFTNAEVEYLEDKISKDTPYVMDTINSMEETYNELVSSGFLDMTIETSDSEKNKELKERFSRIVEYILVLEGFTEEYKYFYQISYLEHPDLNMDAFLIGYSSYIAKNKLVFDITSEISDNEYVETILNEKIPDIGKSYVYHALKNRIDYPDVHVRINTGRMYVEYISAIKGESPLVVYSKDAFEHITGGFDHTIMLSTDNILDTFEKNTMDKWLPMQKRIANILGDTKITTRHDYFITEEQVLELYPLFEPGDIMFQRRNWYVSNIGMPGFWTHSALYIGSLEELDLYFKEESMEMFDMPLSDYLKENYPKVYSDKLSGELTTLEGKSEGVVMLSMEESGLADYLAFIRPKLSKKDKLLAILEGFEHYGKLYDFNFDFSTDDTLVCSEVVYKAYLSNSEKQGLRYNLTMIAGRWMLSPYDMVRTFDENYGMANEQNEFVFFLDGNEGKGVAEFKDVEEFRESWERPKYDILLE